MSRRRRYSRAGAKAIRVFPLAAFAFVMAIGIISAGTHTLGLMWVSRTLLAAAIVGINVPVAPPEASLAAPLRDCTVVPEL